MCRTARGQVWHKNRPGLHPGSKDKDNAAW
jgi:hypothetical protein